MKYEENVSLSVCTETLSMSTSIMINEIKQGHDSLLFIDFFQQNPNVIVIKISKSNS